jgi:hypothetical protein
MGVEYSLLSREGVISVEGVGAGSGASNHDHVLVIIPSSEKPLLKVRCFPKKFQSG